MYLTMDEIEYESNSLGLAAFTLQSSQIVANVKKSINTFNPIQIMSN